MLLPSSIMCKDTSYRSATSDIEQICDRLPIPVKCRRTVRKVLRHCGGQKAGPSDNCHIGPAGFCKTHMVICAKCQRQYINGRDCFCLDSSSSKDSTVNRGRLILRHSPERFLRQASPESSPDSNKTVDSKKTQDKKRRRASKATNKKLKR